MPALSEPVLDELSHHWHINGKILTGVTRAIRAVWPNKPSFDAAPPGILEHARKRGDRVDHWVCEYARLNGRVDVEDDADVVESVELFDRWWNKVKPAYIDHQRMVWNEDYIGFMDLLLNIDGRPTIVDVKRTYNEEQTWGIQVGGYRDLYHHMQNGDQFHVEDLAVLHIHPRFKHGYVYRRYDTAQAVEWWRSTVAFYRTVQAIAG